MALIQVTPELLNSRANELRGYKGEHDEAINKIKNLVNSLPEEFKGKSATDYIEKFQGMESTFANFSQLLEDLAKELDVVADRIGVADGQR